MWELQNDTVVMRPVVLTSQTALCCSTYKHAYHHFNQVFNEAKTTLQALLLRHVLPGSGPSKGCLFSLSTLEKNAMKDYIMVSQASNLICPSSSLAGASFFIEKKDMTLGGRLHRDRFLKKKSIFSKTLTKKCVYMKPYT